MLQDEHITYIIYGIFFLVAFLFSFFINGLFVKFSKNLGIRNIDENMIRWASKSKPAFGGISFYIVFLISAISYSFFFSQTRILFNPQFLGLLGACTIGFMMGLADDAYNTRPFLKFLAQISCGLLLYFTNTCINFFENDFLNAIVTTIWVVGIMNSINMLDNMDGITTTVSIGILITILLVVLSTKDLANYDIIMLLGGIAALSGFIIYNWNPSQMYMGDTGSQFLGVFLAAMSIKYLWDADFSTDIPYDKLNKVLLVVSAFILPLTDTATVIINRLGRGQSPFIGGKDHTTHHLSYTGLSDKRVALVFASISAVSILITLLLFKFSLQTNAFMLVATVFIIAIFCFLFGITRTKKARAKTRTA